MPRFVFIILLFTFAVPTFAKTANREWTIDGVKRTGIVVTPDDDVKMPKDGFPVVFVFHGHGGRAAQIQKQFAIEKSWPEVIVVYLQGLPTIGQITDPDGTRPGWNDIAPPDKNRDIQFFDAVLKDVLDHDHGDAKNVFSTGHSNGGGFTFTLWAYRGDEIKAVAPTSSISPAKQWPMLKPKPALMSSGRNDPLVKFAWQSAMMDKIKTLNDIDAKGKIWGTDGTLYESKTGTPFVTIITDGGHPPPKDIGVRVVDFFKSTMASEK